MQCPKQNGATSEVLARVTETGHVGEMLKALVEVLKETVSRIKAIR